MTQAPGLAIQTGVQLPFDPAEFISTEEARRRAGVARKCLASTSTTAALRIRPWSCWSKELRMFIDRKEVGGPNEFARMSDEELEAFLRESIE